MSDKKEMKKEEFNDLVWDKEYLKALNLFKDNKDDVIFDKWEVHHLAEGMHKLGYYQESYASWNDFYKWPWSNRN